MKAIKALVLLPLAAAAPLQSQAAVENRESHPVNNSPSTPVSGRSGFSGFGPTVIRNPPPGSIKEGYRYARAVQLRYQTGSSASMNGTMLGTYQWLTASGGNIPIYRSTDEGRTWTSSPITQVSDTAHDGYMLTSQPSLYELPIAIGDMPAGTILLSALAKKGETGGNTYIDLYKSADGGTSWTYVSTIAQGGQPVEGSDPVWEPFMYAYNKGASNRLVVYYSDERDPRAAQKLVHQVTTNGTTWGPVVDDVVDPDSKGRPGMPVVAKMNNGQYIMTYEHCATRDCRVEYRLSSDPEDWINATEYPLQMADGSMTSGTPYVVYLPGVGPNGAVVVSPRYPGHLFVNYHYATPASRWVQMQAVVDRAWSRSFVPMGDGKTLFITSTPIQPNGIARWEVGNQHLGDVPSEVTTGNWYLVNRNSGKYLEVANSSAEDGGLVSEYAFSGTHNQKWRFEPASDGYYRIINVNSGKYLEVQKDYVADNRPIQQGSATSAAGQQWRVVDRGTGYIQLFNRNSGKPFDVHGSTASQPQMLQYRDTGSFAQQWELVKAPSVGDKVHAAEHLAR